MQKLKEVVLICYQFHKSVFLLRFCNDLSSYEHASLRFINNYNSTTSLFDRRSNKLLVTFRNENMVSLILKEKLTFYSKLFLTVNFKLKKINLKIKKYII